MKFVEKKILNTFFDINADAKKNNKVKVKRKFKVKKYYQKKTIDLKIYIQSDIFYIDKCKLQLL